MIIPQAYQNNFYGHVKRCKLAYLFAWLYSLGGHRRKKIRAVIGNLTFVYTMP